MRRTERATRSRGSSSTTSGSARTIVAAGVHRRRLLALQVGEEMEERERLKLGVERVLQLVGQMLIAASFRCVLLHATPPPTR
tara:strand:+ start:435 stop:683 length:249 start_codon:yes stop_codon:yes gene_type:complete